jgi:hypothetical protein
VEAKRSEYEKEEAYLNLLFVTFSFLLLLSRSTPAMSSTAFSKRASESGSANIEAYGEYLKKHASRDDRAMSDALQLSCIVYLNDRYMPAFIIRGEGKHRSQVFIFMKAVFGTIIQDAILKQKRAALVIYHMGQTHKILAALPHGTTPTVQIAFAPEGVDAAVISVTMYNIPPALISSGHLVTADQPFSRTEEMASMLACYQMGLDWDSPNSILIRRSRALTVPNDYMWIKLKHFQLEHSIPKGEGIGQVVFCLEREERVGTHVLRGTFVGSAPNIVGVPMRIMGMVVRSEPTFVLYAPEMLKMMNSVKPISSSDPPVQSNLTGAQADSGTEGSGMGRLHLCLDGDHRDKRFKSIVD